MDNPDKWMELAVRIGDRGVGKTAENPSVGCVIVQSDCVIATARTGDNGRPHAERIALDMALDFANETKGADAYVTLEPCAHHGQTSPCADALIQAGIARVFCPFQDPDPRVAGQGFAKLRDAGIEVIHPCLDEIPIGLRPFLTTKILGRPYSTLKIATSMDGKIALGNGNSQWISNAHARRYTRFLRSQHHTIAVGIGTILADDPQLDNRILGVQHNPRPVIFDGQLRTPLDAKIRASNPVFFHRLDLPTPSDVDGIGVPYNDSGLDLTAAMSQLVDHGCQSIMVEGGAEIAASFLRADLIDQIVHVTTGSTIGSDGRNALGELAIQNMDAIPRFRYESTQTLDGDSVITYSRDALNLRDFLPNQQPDKP